MVAENLRARRLVCGDVGERLCLSACPDELPPRDHADCLIRFRLAADPEAAGWARSLFARTNALVGVEVRPSVEGYRGEEVALFPALPVGEHRHHLKWLDDSLATFDAFVATMASRTERPVRFRPWPDAFVFFQTAVPSYPSAFCSDGIIAYNVRGLLHANPRDVHETLFHELFHINDVRHGGWSAIELRPLFDSIVARCGDDHGCYGPFAPHHTVVAGGTYYAFDPRTREVREYAAELALRYFLEQEAILTGQREMPPFKCLTPENGVAWGRMVDEFFGGADLSRPCDGRAISTGKAGATTHSGS